MGRVQSNSLVSVMLFIKTGTISQSLLYCSPYRSCDHQGVNCEVATDQSTHTNVLVDCVIKQGDNSCVCSSSQPAVLT